MINKSNIYIYFGALFSQIVTLITSFIVLKYVSPEVYGKFSYIIALGSILGSVATLKFEQSISISSNENDSFKKLIITFQTSLYITLLFLPFIFYFFEVTILQLFLVFLLSISIALSSSLQQFFLYINKHKLNAILSVSIAFINFILLIFLYKYHNGLEISYVLSYLISTLIFMVYTNYRIIKVYLLKIADYTIFFKELYVFPKIVLPGAIISILLLYANPVILKYIYSEKEVGMFSFTIRVLTLPVILVSSVSSGLFKAKMSKIYFEKDFDAFKNEKKKLLIFLLSMMFISYIILLLAMNNINQVSIFKKWEFLDKTSNLLVLYACSQFLYLPFTSLPLILKKEKLLILSNIILFCVIFTFYLVVYYANLSFENFLKTFSIINLCYSIYFVVKFYNLKFKED